jgi:hypothetical protein
MARQIKNETSLKSKVRERDALKTNRIAAAVAHAVRQIRHMSRVSYSPAYDISEIFKENEAKVEQRKAEAIEYLHRSAATLC